MLAYDDLYSIQYMKKNLRPYWRRNGWEAADLLQGRRRRITSRSQQRCAAFDAELMADLTQRRRREVRQALRARLSPVLRRGQVRRRRQRPAAPVLQGKPLQRLHRHLGRVLPDGAAVPALRAVAGQVVPRAVHELRRERALEVPLRAARPRHVSRTPTARSMATASAPRTTRCPSRRAATCCSSSAPSRRWKATRISPASTGRSSSSGPSI